MRFHTYDFNKSSFVNYRDEIKKISMTSGRKSSVWRKNYVDSLLDGWSSDDNDELNMHTQFHQSHSHATATGSVLITNATNLLYCKSVSFSLDNNDNWNDINLRQENDTIPSINDLLDPDNCITRVVGSDGEYEKDDNDEFVVKYNHLAYTGNQYPFTDVTRNLSDSKSPTNYTDTDDVTYNPISILDFVRKYQVENGIGIYDENKTNVSLSDIRDMYEYTIGHLNSDVIYYVDSIQSYLKYTKDSKENGIRGFLSFVSDIPMRFKPEENVSISINANAFNSVTYSDKPSEALYSVITEEEGEFSATTPVTEVLPRITAYDVDGNKYYPSPGSYVTFKSLDMNEDETRELAEDSSEINYPSYNDRAMYITLEKAAEVISKNYDLDVYRSACDSCPNVMQLVALYFSKDAILSAVQTLIDEVDKQIEVLDANEEAALDRPIGKILKNEGYLTQFLETDISQLSLFNIAFSIQQMDGINVTDDEDIRTPRGVFLTMKDSLGKRWHEYFYAILYPFPVFFDGDNPSDDDKDLYAVQYLSTDEEGGYGSYYIAYLPVAYVPNYTKMLKISPTKRMAILQACIGIQTNTKKPKHKTNWLNVVLAVVILVIVTVASWGTLTAEVTPMLATFAYASAVVATVATVAYEMTGSKTWANVAEAAGIASIATSFLQTITTKAIAARSALMRSAMIQYTFKAIDMFTSKYFQRQLAKKQNEMDALSEEIDEVKEMISDAEYDQKIKNFIYGEHIDNQYTSRYNYDIEYKY